MSSSADTSLGEIVDGLELLAQTETDDDGGSITSKGSTVEVVEVTEDLPQEEPTVSQSVSQSGFFFFFKTTLFLCTP